MDECLHNLDSLEIALNHFPQDVGLCRSGVNVD